MSQDLKMEFSTMQPFAGEATEDAKLWLERFKLFAIAKGFNANKAKASLPLLLKDNALRWYLSLPPYVKDSYEDLKTEFLTRYGPDESTKWKRTVDLYQLKQTKETAEDYITKVTNLAAEVDLPEEQLKAIVLNGLKPQLQQFVLQKEPRDMEEVRKTAKLAEATNLNLHQHQDQLVAAIERLEERFEAMTVQINAAQQTQDVSNTYTPRCQRCGLQSHTSNQQCPAYGKTCYRCGKQNHFSRMCRVSKRARQQ
ncbi:uncharacterized protein [Argopecten irradians]|uniref:uncharacterized protein n=1 Tax=Argopecten irradians TaxID=31199 RepID=UPI00371ABFBA